MICSYPLSVIGKYVIMKNVILCPEFRKLRISFLIPDSYFRAE